MRWSLDHCPLNGRDEFHLAADGFDQTSLDRVDFSCNCRSHTDSPSSGFTSGKRNNLRNYAMLRRWTHWVCRELACAHSAEESCVAHVDGHQELAHQLEVFF